jgi:hypothetical protein
MLIKYLWLIYAFVFILDFSLELEQEDTDSINVRQPINARGIPSLINILQGITTDH